MNEPKKITLSPARRELLDLCWEMEFGWIEGLVLRNAEPILDPPPEIHRTIKFQRSHQPRSGPETGAYVMRDDVVDVLRQFDLVRDATIDELTVRGGLPREMNFVDPGCLSRSRTRGRRAENRQ